MFLWAEFAVTVDVLLLLWALFLAAAYGTFHRYALLGQHIKS
jgi:hypothetical protein